MSYAPLQFVDQCRSIYRGNDRINGIKCEDYMNEKHCEWFDTFFKVSGNRESFILDFFALRNILLNTEKFPKDSIWNNIKKSYMETIIPKQVQSPTEPLNDLDFFEFMLQYCIAEDWKYHKLTYKLTPKLAYDFCNMELPKELKNHTVTKFPADCFYIDLSSCGDDICEGIEGIFVNACISKLEDTKVLCIELLSLIRGTHGNLMPVYDQLIKGYNENEDDFSEVSIVEADEGNFNCLDIIFEDGVRRKFNIDKLHSFFFNFLVYLHASNKDVEESECSKGAFSKPINKNKEPKNKFSEIRQYEVGYRISSPYPKKKGNTISLGSGGGSPKSSHYRSAHWHHFWTGSGADKKLIVKWVDGVFVNGKAEQSVAVVHSVK